MKFYYYVVAFMLLVSCKCQDNYGICFHLGDSEQKVISYLNKHNVEHRYEDGTRAPDGKLQTVLRVKHFEFNQMEFNTVRLLFDDNVITGIQFRTHEKDNIKRVIAYLTKQYGFANDNKNWTEDSDLAKSYWGSMNKNYILVEECEEDYYKFHFCSHKNKDAVNIFRNNVIGVY